MTRRSPGSLPSTAHKACARCLSGSARFGVQPTATKSVLVRSALQASPAYWGESEVFWSSGPLTKGLIDTLLMIGGIESNPGMYQKPYTPSGLAEGPKFHIPPWQEVQESARPKPPDTQRFFEEWKKNRNQGAEASTRSADQPAQPQELEQLLVSGGGGEPDGEQGGTALAPSPALPTADAPPTSEPLQSAALPEHASDPQIEPAGRVAEAPPAPPRHG
ncbi:hypothetical protein KFL_002740195 [Klebsormidium nitens]|uniref:Uncharacterized protein n=1 Tax=Klebsormidium nitens TaxID=105231 RepID=A0A1Y1I8A4_KLENI|nr:hypothetical protein KFL_002740195 [Klebsormidium nitens]|eukprot:GAQ86182.1 hypothetical protein KFL_002740195 [Klebsormidium nitens]